MIRFCKVFCLLFGPERPQSKWMYLGWEGQAIRAKMHGILGTVGTLARFLGKYARFSRVPKSANGTVEIQRSEIGDRYLVLIAKR
jgi:hypothetical protein